jgi:hypothetical protein
MEVSEGHLLKYLKTFKIFRFLKKIVDIGKMLKHL